MRIVAIGAAIVASAVLLAGGAGAAPASFQLVFTGSHAIADFPTPSGLKHEGPFTTSYPLCSSGYASDIAQTEQTATRRFACAGSTTTFTAVVGSPLAEHGGGGSWEIIAGTGALANLRGKGSFASVILSGNLADPRTITFRSTWRGVVDLDASPPTIALTRGSARKLAHPARTYLVHVGLSVSDGNSNPVSYTLILVDPRNLWALARKMGTTSSGKVSFVFRVRPTARTRFLRLTVTADDPVGNEAVLKKPVLLGSRS